MRGWFGYFQLAARNDLVRLFQWTCRHMRKYLWQRWRDR
ncbi:hypothetical protein [Pseudomonas sp. S60]|nr:hypothetical protein [Pseudomonas sp. S60]